MIIYPSTIGVALGVALATLPVLLARRRTLIPPEGERPVVGLSGPHRRPERDQAEELRNQAYLLLAEADEIDRSGGR